MVHTQTDKPSKGEAERVSNTLGDVESEPTDDMLAVSLAEMKAETLSETVVKVKAKALGNSLGDRLAEVEGETLSDTHGEVKAEAIDDMRARIVGGRHPATKWAMSRTRQCFTLLQTV